jgi:hypothetical protein
MLERAARIARVGCHPFLRGRHSLIDHAVVDERARRQDREWASRVDLRRPDPLAGRGVHRHQVTTVLVAEVDDVSDNGRRGARDRAADAVVVGDLVRPDPRARCGIDLVQIPTPVRKVRRTVNDGGMAETSPCVVYVHLTARPPTLFALIFVSAAFA